MIETLKRYWVAFLVLAMVGVHATIIAVIRQQAAAAKLSTSCEVDLGAYYVNHVAEGEAIRFRIHAIVPESARIQCRQKLTNRQWEIKQNFEEHLRQIDPELFKDPTLGEVKDQLMALIVQQIDETTIDEILITELEPAGKMAKLSFDATLIKPRSHGHLVAAHSEDEEAGHEASEVGHDESEHDAHAHSGHEPAPAKTKSSGHGAAKSSGHGGSKSSGHGSSKSAGHGTEKSKSSDHKAPAASGHGKPKH